MMPTPNPPRACLVTWDWREQPDLTRLASLIDRLSGGAVQLREVETDSDQYAVILANRPQSDLELRRYWDEHLHDGEDEWTW